MQFPRCFHLLVLAVLALDTAMGDEPIMRLRLKDGSFATGQLVPSTLQGHIGWHAEGFESPFQFEVNSVRSIAYENQTDSDEAPTGFVVELNTGASVHGELVAMTPDLIRLKSPLLGEIAIDRSIAISIADARYLGKLIYSGPLSDDDWNADRSFWVLDDRWLSTDKPGSVAACDVQIPGKAQLDVTLSWKGTPDFVFSFGTEIQNRNSRMDQIPSAGRLEVWDKQLALVREVEGGADIALVSDLAGSRPRITLTILIDQLAGRVLVCDSHGRPLDQVVAESPRAFSGSGVQLTNHGTSLTLENLVVREWDGRSRSFQQANGGLVIDADGVERPAFIVGYDAESQQFLLDSNGRRSRLDRDQLRRGDLLSGTQLESQIATGRKLGNASRRPPPVRQPPQLGVLPGDEQPLDVATAEVAPRVQPSQVAEAIDNRVEVVLSDMSRFSGEILPSDSGLIRCRTTDLHQLSLDGYVKFLPSEVRGLIGGTGSYNAPVGSFRQGTIKLNRAEMNGWLVEDSSGETTSLFWRPNGSENAAELSNTASGAIVYRRQLPQFQTGSKLQSNSTVPLLNIFATANRDNTPGEALEGSRDIDFRTGDSIEGVVDRIDESGMTFRSRQTTTTFAPHDQIQSISLNGQRSATDFDQNLLDRLMTVPRSMKRDPPTHLFLSINGDYLRGRLLSLDQESARVAVRLETVEIPRANIADIIWLHDRDWEGESADSENQTEENTAALPFRIHAISQEEQGLTFVPEKVESGFISGTSPLLGSCTIHVNNLSRLLFGRDIGKKVREFKNDPWTLSLAQMPRAFQDPLSSPDSLGSHSALVGQPAPDFVLQTLDGLPFRLQTPRNRILVLDFWASWCGPCITSMPMLEAAVEELGHENVQLVAVNLQESPERVQAAVDKLGLNSTVILDSDGKVATDYGARAIPQTVIIDQSGNVTHVFVGGGSRMIEQFKIAVQSLLN